MVVKLIFIKKIKAQRLTEIKNDSGMGDSEEYPSQFGTFPRSAKRSQKSASKIISPSSTQDISKIFKIL